MLSFAFFGDSTAMAPGGAFGIWAKSTGRARLLGGLIVFRCGISRGGTRIHHGNEFHTDAGCPNWATTWADFLSVNRADAVVIIAGPEEVEDRKLPGASDFSHIGQPDVDANLTSEILEATRVVEQHGAVAIWVTSPHLQFGRDRIPLPTEAMNEPQRIERYNQLLYEAAKQHPSMKVVDLATDLQSLAGGEFDENYRPDGIHLTDKGADAVLERWMGDELLAAVARRG